MVAIIISVEGNIASGKSTFVTFLKQNIPNAIFLQEPVDEWNEVMDDKSETILTKFYKNQAKYSFAFQMMAYISRLALLKKTVEESPPHQVIITERCLNTDREVFAKMLYENGMIGQVEYQIYLKWFYNFQCDYPIAKYLYLRTDPEVANVRVLKRNRPGETINIEYLSQCHTYHESWLKNSNISSDVITIDANENEDKMNQWLSVVQSIIINK